MYKQRDDQETGTGNGDASVYTEAGSCKRESDERHTGAEKKRARSDAAVERSDDLSKDLTISEKGEGRERGGGEQQEVSVAIEKSSRDVLERGGGADSVGEASMEVKRMSPAEKGVREKNRRNLVVTTLTAEVAEDRGSRLAMEDASVILPQAWLDTPWKLRLAHFAIYDGHGGRHAAEFASAHLHANVLSAGLTRELKMDIKAVKRAIVQGRLLHTLHSGGFKSTDEALLRESSAGGWPDGATAVSVWVLGQMVFVANLGDAKAVLARAPAKADGAPLSDTQQQGAEAEKEAPLKGLVVTREHKAIFPQERARIEKAGGFVESNGRLLGRLEVSRAFGDRNFKKAGVIATPDIHVFELSEREHFLILGCDGLWGVFGPSDAVEFVGNELKGGATVGMACKRLIREAVRERKCKDNCTAIVINFEHRQI